MKKNNAFKRVCSLIIALVMAVCILPAVYAEDGAEPFMTPEEARSADLPAFPGAEGGGKYTTGGRGGEVYHVTNLNDDGPGSLRDAVSRPNRTVVFDVDGTIYLDSTLNLTQPNITIAGQTAPGGGICIANYNIVIQADNIIMRYLRIRPGGAANAETDAVFGRYQQDIILDHCSTSWSSDETLSIYGVAHTTVQWCIISESLTLGTHAKGRHGYGGIWGGNNVSYHHNLVATHTSRLPRYASASSTHPDYEGINNNDMVNNVIYNWGFNNSYGAEEATVNVINNYYKWGPITNADVRGRIWNPPTEGRFYFSGNVLEGNSEVTENNMLGLYQNEGDPPPEYVSAPIYETLIPLDNIDTAEDAYEKVLETAGAILPVRDSYDAKIVDDVENGTGRAINSETEVGGWPVLRAGTPKADTDGDGMPDEYEDANGLDKNNAEDGKAVADNRYTNLENYLNSLADNAPVPENPDVALEVEENSIFEYGEAVEFAAGASAASGRSITNVEFYMNGELIGEDSTAPYSITYSETPEGTNYLVAVAYDSEGETTTSEEKTVNINYTGSVAPWQTMDIGEATMEGSYSLNDGVYTVKSSGLIGPGNEFNIALGDPTTDSFSYMYRTIDTNSVLSTKISEVSRHNNNCSSGIMMRDELTPTSDFVMVNYEVEKGGAGLAFKYRQNGEYTREFLKLETLPRYVKLVKEGGTVTAYHSENGVDWNMLSSAEVGFSGTNYGGVAQDGNKETNMISTYSWGKFEELTLENYGENAIPQVDLKISLSQGDGSDKNQYFTDDEIRIDITSESDTLSKVELYLDGVLYAEDSSAPFEQVVSGLEPGSHSVTAVAYDEDGAKNSASESFGVSQLQGALEGFSVVSVGDGRKHGAFESDTNGNVTVYGAGYGIADVANEDYPFAYTQMSGDFTVSFKVDEQEVGDYDQVGLLIRDGLNAGDNSYGYYFQIYNGELLARNSSAGTKYENIGQQKYKETPVWLRLTKSGNTLAAEYSQNGTEWINVGTEEISVADNYYFGLFGASAEDFDISEFRLSEFSLQLTDGSYIDMSGFEWADPAVNYLTDMGIVSGIGGGYFLPAENVTRAEFAKMITEAYEQLNPSASAGAAAAGFTDVPESSDEWYVSYVQKAYGYGLIQGTTSTTFEPDRNITREEMAVMVCRAIDSADSHTDVYSMNFADISNISDWAAPCVDELYKLGIMQGDQNNCFNPQIFAQRAEAAQVIYNMLMAER